MRCIDLFAGLGGFTEGAEMAGARVVWAANHAPNVLEVHERNHPHVSHVCQDLRQADFTKVPAYDCLLASPACQGHSVGRGKERPHHDALRATAWAVVDAVECGRPNAFVVENVPRFTLWTLFPVWCDALKKLGYALSVQVLNAAAYGVPQDRPRVIVVGVRGKRAMPLEMPKAPELVPAAAFLDFEDGTWAKVRRRGRASRTLARVRRGREQFGDRFVMPYYGNGSGLTGRSIARPIGTITTRARWAVVDGKRMRMLTLQETRAAMGFRDSYTLPGNRVEAIHMLGNAVPPPLAAAVVGAVMAKI